MHKKVFTVIFILLALTAGSVMAQDMPPVFCGALTDADCALLTESQTATASLESLGFRLNGGLTLDGIPGMVTPLAFQLSADGSFGLAQTRLESLNLAQVLADDPSQFPQAFTDVISAISADGTLLLVFPQELVDLTANDSSPIPEKIGLGFRMVDGIAYFNLEKLTALAGDGFMPRGWVGLDIAGFYRQIFETQTGLFSNGLFDGSLAYAGQFNAFQQIERLADTTVDGQPAAVFKTSLDLDGLFSSAELQTFLRDYLLNNPMMAGSGFGEQELNMLLNMYAVMFDGMVYEITQTIGLDDHYSHGGTLHIAWPLDLNAVLAASGMSGGDLTYPPIHITADFNLALDQFNAAPAIIAPENPLMIPLDGMFGSGSTRRS